MGTQSPPIKKAHSSLPRFTAHVYCAQTAGWIKMPLGTQVGLGTGDIVLDGDPTPPQKGAQQPPTFGQCPLPRNGWLDKDSTWYGGRPRARPHCVRLGPSSPHGKWHSSPPATFRLTLLWHGCQSEQLLSSCCTCQASVLGTLAPPDECD